jgi:Predicted membrane protein
MYDKQLGTSKEDLVKHILDNDKDLDNCQLDEDIIHTLLSGKVSTNINKQHDDNSTFGQRAADKIASSGGSWTFITIFGAILLMWIGLNTLILFTHAFDPYPFVFLNLMLSCLAAIQAPIIMMSQNRQAEKDRLTAANDYLVNLKSELIIEHMHYKLDELLEKQTQTGILELKSQLQDITTNQVEILKQLTELKKV